MVKRIKSKIANDKTLGDMPIGSIVKIPENGVAVNYIIVHNGKPSSLYDDSCDGVWLLREKTLEKRAWHGKGLDTSVNDYENSQVQSWLNDEFLNSIDEKIRAAIKTVKIPFKKSTGNGNGGVQGGANGLNCKIFLLSGYEVGFTTDDCEYVPVDGAKLSYFSDANSRIGKDSTNTAVYWWLRSPHTSYAAFVFYVYTDGSLSNYDSCCSAVAVRPAFVLPSSLLVEYKGKEEAETISDIMRKPLIEISNIISAEPSADVAPVVRGHWFGTVCTACGESTSFYYDCNYCPYCGAKMDGKEREDNA